MSNGIISRLIEEIEENNNDIRVEEHIMVNVRPSEKVLSMLDFIMKISGRNFSSEISEIISSKLVDIACSSIEYAEPILNASEQVFNNGYTRFQEGCAFDILCNEGYIKYELAPTESELKMHELFDKDKIFSKLVKHSA